MRVKIGCCPQLLNGFVQASRLRQCQPEIVMSLGQIRIAHDGLPELGDCMRMIISTPIEQTQARMCLGIVRFQFERLLKGSESMLRIVLSLQSQPQIVITGRKLWTFVDCFLKKAHSIVELLLLQCSNALKDQ